MHKKSILILDFGSQFNQLVARKVRELGVYAEIIPFNTPITEIIKREPKGIILSGETISVSDVEALKIGKEIFDLNIPIFGISYGMQLIVELYGGKLNKVEKKEYEKSPFTVVNESRLFKNISNNFTTWYNYSDEILELPQGFKNIGKTDNMISSISNEDKNIYAVQFHPEVDYTEFGKEIFSNFVFEIAKCEKNWNMSSYIDAAIKHIKDTVGDKKVVLGLSGGVDSSVAAVLINQAIGENLTCIFVDTGLLRKDEAKKVMETYGKHYNMNIKLIDAEDRFLGELKDVSDPETKRKIIGKEFVHIFQEEAKKLDGVEFLAQGTIYADVVESQSVKGAKSTIKSHHNVGGLPETLNLKLLEPLRELFKDEVRKVGYELGIPREMIDRHPFPGPGLGIRILGDITKEKANILREADQIFIDEIGRAHV